MPASPQIEKPRSAAGIVINLADNQSPAFQIIQIFAYGDTGESDPVSNQGTGDGLFVFAEKINDFFHKPVNIILTEGGIGSACPVERVTSCQIFIQSCLKSGMIERLDQIIYNAQTNSLGNKLFSGISCFMGHLWAVLDFQESLFVLPYILIT